MFQYIKTKCFNSTILYTTDALFYNSSVQIGSSSFFSSFDMQKFHYLLGCYAAGSNSFFIFFFKFFAFFKFSTPSQKADIIRLKIKAICLIQKL